MALELGRQKVHSLVALLPSAKLGPVRDLLEALVGNAEEVTEEDRCRLLASRDYFASGGQAVAMEDVLADFGLTLDDFPVSK